MEITLGEYIKNPTGGRSHMVGQKDAAQAVYSDKFNKMMLRSAGRIKFQLYKNGEERYTMVLHLPSESIDKLSYDVVLDFYTKDDIRMKERHLKNYKVRFFSNDPNFTFTYSYVFQREGLIVPELISKLSPESKKEPPKTTNPTHSVGYVKSIYFAYLFYQLRGFENKLTWTGAPKFNKNEIQSNVMASSRKLLQVDHLKSIERATKKGSMSIDANGSFDRLTKSANAADSFINATNAYNRAKKAKQAATIKTIKKVPTVKTVGRVKKIL